MNTTREIVTLLRACAKGTDHIESKQAAIFTAAADRLEELTEEIRDLKREDFARIHAGAEDQ